MCRCAGQVVAQSWLVYCKSSWNKMDIIIVFTSDLEMLINFIAGEGTVSWLTLFRIFRALRPLRIVASKLPGLSILVRTAILSFEPLCNTMVLVLAAGLLLGLFLMQLMGGGMNACSDAAMWTKSQCVGLDDDGVPREWKRYYINFDNLGQALFAQLMIATEDDWPAHMLIGMDVSGKHTGPFANNSLVYAFFYMLSMVAMAFVVINMVVGVFVEAYYQALDEKMAEDKAGNVPHVSPMLQAADLPDVFADPEPGTLRDSCLFVVLHEKFDQLIGFLICSNVLAMACESWKSHSAQQVFGNVSNAFFAVVFGAECILKLIALRPRRYLYDHFNKFDFFLVMVTYIGYSIEGLGTLIEIDPETLRLLRMLRILRILRALRLIKAFPDLKKVMWTLIKAGSACGNLVAMLGLLFFMFSVVLVNVFGSMCVAGDELRPGLQGVTCMFTPEDNLLDRHAHFQGVGIAMITLFRIATGDAWGEVMESATLQPPTDTWGFYQRPREPITDDAWASYVSLFGESLPGGASQTTTRGVDIAVAALKRWHEVANGGEAAEDWPIPGGAGEEFLKLARVVLPNCLTTDEAMHLQSQGVADCSVPGDYHSSGRKDCLGTCGSNPFIVYLAFYLFYAFAAFVLFQLVIGVLMDIYIKVEEDMSKPPPCPGCDNLTVPVLKRLHKRWLLHARVKTGRQTTKDPVLVARAASMRRLWSSPNRIVPTNDDEDGGARIPCRLPPSSAVHADITEVAAPSSHIANQLSQSSHQVSQDAKDSPLA